jgi:hypothetical protein
VVLQFGTKDGKKRRRRRRSPSTGKDTHAYGDLVLSGFVKTPDSLDGKPAILDLPVGKGRVILYATNPLHRYLTHADFRYVYNLILNWNDLPD